MACAMLISHGPCNAHEAWALHCSWGIDRAMFMRRGPRSEADRKRRSGVLIEVQTTNGCESDCWGTPCVICWVVVVCFVWIERQQKSKSHKLPLDCLCRPERRSGSCLLAPVKVYLISHSFASFSLFSCFVLNSSSACQIMSLATLLSRCPSPCASLRCCHRDLSH